MRICGHCDKELNKRQKKFCSHACQMRANWMNPSWRDNHPGYKRWISWNDHFFDELSPDAAYMLGFLVADGFVLNKLNPLRANSRIHQIGFHQKDPAILERIAGVLNYEGDLGGSGNSPCKNLRLGSKYAWHIMTEKYGIPAGKEKSYTVRIPDIVKEDHVMLPYFMRGLFDGDGHVSKNGRQFAYYSGSDGLIDDVINILVNELGLPRHEKVWDKGNYQKTDGTQSGCWSVRWSSSCDSMIFAQYIYGPERDVYGSELFLKRKKERFDQLFVSWRDKDWLFQKFVVEGKSFGRIASDCFGATASGVASWIDIYDLREARSRHWNLELGI